METGYFPQSRAHTALRKVPWSEFPVFEKVLGIQSVENHSWLFPSLPDTDGVPERACPSVPAFLGYPVLSQVAFLLAPTLHFFPGT